MCQARETLGRLGMARRPRENGGQHRDREHAVLLNYAAVFGVGRRRLGGTLKLSWTSSRELIDLAL